MTLPTSEPAGDARRAWIGPTMRPVLTALLAVVGVQFWLIAADGLWGLTRQLWAVAGATAVALLAACIPGVRNRLTSWIDLLRSPSPRRRRAIGLCVGILAGAYLFSTAKHQGRAFEPVVQDEYSYLIQAHMIAQGGLWLPKHEVADAFDTFHMISDPVYASKYFPGAGLAIAAALKLGLPPWLPALVCSSAAVGLLYVLLAELLDGWAGLLGVVLLLSVRMFRRLSVAYMSQPLFLVLMLVAVLAYLRWRRGGRGAWMAVLGACVGGAAITRPLDALCIAVPLAVAIGVDLVRGWVFPGQARGDVGSTGAKRVLLAVRTITIGIVGVAPFLVLQLVANRGITGRWLDTPWSYYARHDDPYDALGWRPVTPDVHTRSVVPQKRLAEQTFTIMAHRQRLERPFFDLFLHKRLQYVLDDALPWIPLVALIPLGVLALGRPGRWVLWAGMPLFALGYTFHTVYLSHYVVNAAPAVIFAVLAGAWAAAAARRPAAAGAVTIVLSTVLLAAAATTIPEVGGTRTDDFESANYLRGIDRRLAALADRPSLVLFRFGEGANPILEPVYNADVAWPDDARVIRAHDLGVAANRKLFEYYARRDPSRRVYLFDRTKRTDPLVYLGTVRELAAPRGGLGA